MAWTFSGVRDALATRLDTVSGLRPYDTVPAVPAVPADGGGAAVVAPGEPFVSYDDTTDGCATLSFVVTVLVGKVSERASQNALDAFISPTGATSVKAAVDSGAGVDYDYAVVTTGRRYGAYTIGQGTSAIDYLGCEFLVTVGVSA